MLNIGSVGNIVINTRLAVVGLELLLLHVLTLWNIYEAQLLYIAFMNRVENVSFEWNYN